MKTKIPLTWHHETDLLVMGSGGAGLTAAITGADEKLSVILIEKSDKIGGTTAVSGGVIWVPVNHHMANAGYIDTREKALTYTKKLAEGRIKEELIETLVDKGPEMVQYLEKNTELKFSVCKDYPDYHPEWEGAMSKGGRSLAAELFNSNELKEWKDKLRKSPIFSFTPITINEAMEWGVFRNPKNMDMELVSQRLEKGIVGFGEALIGYLFKACLERNIEILLNTAGKELITDEERNIIGMVAVMNGKTVNIKVNHGVVLASGGFEWNTELMKQFLPGPEMDYSTAVSQNEGEGLLMSMDVGANLANMSEAWWFPALHVPGEEYDGKPLMRLCLAERSLPHSIIVNKYGKRFMNEAHNYNDISKSFNYYEPVKGEYPNVPAWLIFDQNFLDRYIFITTMPGDDVPGWIKRADKIEQLAELLNVDGNNFVDTVKRFNANAEKGIDPDFKRGESSYDKYQGDPEHKPNPNLGALVKPPFYAVQIHNSNLGTKGGPVIDKYGRVLDVFNKPINGLYAAGNVAMGVTGPGYGGPGGTIGPAMVFGYLSALHAANRNIQPISKIESHA